MKRELAISVCAGAALGVLHALPAAAQCKQWDATGRWAVIQNNNLNPIFDVRQTGNKFEGTATLNTFSDRMRTTQGTVRGDWLDDNFFAVVEWPGARGIYKGKIRSEGVITGETFDERNPPARVGFRSQRAMKCLTAAAPPPPPQPLPAQPSAPGGLSRNPSAGAIAVTAVAAACKSGFVWRTARPDDLVCVTPDSRARVAEENRTAAARRVAGSPNCIQGFVWREAFNGDLVCVTTQIRAFVREENRLGPSRRQNP